jgi:hypothetical protein
VVRLVQHDKQSRPAPLLNELLEATDYTGALPVGGVRVQVLDRRLRGHDYHVVGQLNGRGRAVRRVAGNQADIQRLSRFGNPPGIAVQLPKCLVEQVERMGQPENLDVSLDDMIGQPLDGSESLAGSGGEDEQTAFARAIGECERAAEGVEGVELMLERGLRHLALRLAAKLIEV